MSFCVNGAKFGPAQYYRDDEQARRVLKACARNPVLVTGLRRIGKSWFLRRFEQILAAGSTRHFSKEGAPSERPLEANTPRRVVVLDGGAEDLGEAVEEIVSAANPEVVLAIDELEKLVANHDRRHLLDRILAYRPLVLTAAPVIHELARAESPRLASFFEEQCEAMVLKPLSPAERAALVRQSCDPGEGVPEDLLSMASWYDWGGHPLVLQQIGSLLRDGHARDAEGLTSAAHARLNLGGPRYGHSLAGETGLAEAQRAVLRQVSAGQAPGDAHVVALLQDHGAVVRRKSGWVVENCVLRRHLQGAIEAKAPVSAPEAPAAVSAGRAPATLKSRAPVRVFSWVHLSDLHFGAGNLGYRFDHKKVMRAIRRDMEANAPRSVDRIFVTGDIAFSGKSEQYKDAQQWLGDLAQAAGIAVDRIRLVPGNHDVDRQVLGGSPLLRCAHHATRAGQVELDELLANPRGREVLGEKLEAYCSFVAGLAGHPAPCENGIDWLEVLDAPSGGCGPVRIAGLSTVWTSDERDGRDTNGDGNLRIAQGPLDELAGRERPGEITFVLTHHPREWLTAEGAALLGQELTRLPHIHLFGHVHDARAMSAKRHGQSGRALWYVAGAAHSDPAEAAKHGYAWGTIRYDPASASWQAGWAPRIFVPAHNEMRADRTDYNLDDEGFAWEPIACTWPAPTS